MESSKELRERRDHFMERERPRGYYQDHTRDERIEKAARGLFELLNKNGYYTIEDLGALANIILKSEGNPPRRTW